MGRWEAIDITPMDVIDVVGMSEPTIEPTNAGAPPPCRHRADLACLCADPESECPAEPGRTLRCDDPLSLLDITPLGA